MSGLVEFRWKGGTGVQIGRSRDFQNVHLTLRGDGIATPNEPLAAGTWFWRVVDEKGSVSAVWSMRVVQRRQGKSRMGSCTTPITTATGALTFRSPERSYSAARHPRRHCRSRVSGRETWGIPRWCGRLMRCLYNGARRSASVT